LAQFRTTADVLDLALANAGEVINGNSPYETDLLNKLNRVHFTLIAGGTIALGRDVTVEIDEVWPWAKSKRPMILELQPKITTGTVTLTLASEVGAFSSAPTVSVAGWYLQIDGVEGTYRIASHTASATAFELDGAWASASITAGGYRIFKLDYDLLPSYLVIDSTNNKINFKKTAGGSELTATLTAGSYTPSDLATHVAAQMTAVAAGPTITGAYSTITKLFTLTSDGAGATTLLPLFASGTNQKQSAHKLLGYDDADSAAALTQTSTYILGGIARLVEPMRAQSGTNQLIMGVDGETFMRNYPPLLCDEGQPTKFTVIGEGEDGSLRVRFNHYAKEKTRIEIDYVPVPRDLKDSGGSVPLVPRKFIDVLEDAASFFIMLLKNDDRASSYAQLVQGKLMSMINQHRGSLMRTGVNFGQTIPRRDHLGYKRRRFWPEEPY
jgi:hypothetical protein